MFGAVEMAWLYIAVQQTYKQSQVDFNRKKTTNINQVTLQLQLHFIHIQISP